MKTIEVKLSDIIIQHLAMAIGSGLFLMHLLVLAAQS